MNNRVKRLVPTHLRTALRQVRERFPRTFARDSFSQEGEDLLLWSVFSRQPLGFYVDVGAHHPWRFSNTFRFYQRGWHGINIDAMPGSMELFRKVRPRDVNLEIGITGDGRRINFDIYNEPALNTASGPREDVKGKPYKVVQTVVIPTRTLASVLSEHVPPSTSVDFLTIDVEGLELEILRSNDWERCRPKAVLAETLRMTAEEAWQSPVGRFLNDHDYTCIAKTLNTSLFVDASWEDLRQSQAQSG